MVAESTDAAQTTEESDVAYDIDTYRHTLQEARHTLDQQLQAFNDVADKAWRIVQLNGIIATIYISAVVNALDVLTFTIPSLLLIGIGLMLMGISVYLAAEGQEAKQVTIGQDGEAFKSVRENDPDEIAYLYKTIEDYESWINDVNEKTESNGTTVNLSKRLLIIGVVFITVGTLLTIRL